MPTPPRYPTIGEALRTVADALDAALSDKEREELGRLAREVLDPARAASVEEALLVRLTEAVPEPYRAWWGERLRAEIAAYRHHVCNEPIGPRSRAGVVWVWIKEQSQSWTLPPALLHGLPRAPGEPPDLSFDGVLGWLSEAAGGSLGTLECVVERSRPDLEPGSLERKWGTWTAGTLPDRASIGELARAGIRMPGADPIAPALIEGRFLAARAFAYAQRQIDALRERAHDVAETLDTPPALARVLTLSEPSRPKVDRDDEALAAAIEELEEEGGPYGFVAALGRGRRRAQAGRHGDALAAYEEAVNAGLYRAGNLLSAILCEGLTVAAVCERRVPFRRFYGTAHRFGLLDTSYDDLVNEERLDAVMARWAKKVPAVFPHSFPCSAARTVATDRLKGMLVEPGLWQRRGQDGTVKTVKITSRNVNFKFPGFGQRPLRPIVIAAGAGEPEEVERLLGLGADPNWVASDGSTALIRCLQTCEQTEGAARERAVAAAHRLLEEDLTASINARTHESRVTALGSAVAAGLPDLVRWVLAQGASVDGHHGMEDASPLYWSIQQWALGLLTVDGMSTLLKEEAQWGPGGVEAALRVPGLPPLFADAARRLRAGAPQTEAYAVIAPVLLKRQRDRADAFIESAYLLLDHGASPNAAAASSFTPLLSGLQMYARRAHWMGWDMARRRVLLDLIEGMVAAGGDLNGAGPTGESGWSYAHEANDPELLLRIVPPLST